MLPPLPVILLLLAALLPLAAFVLLLMLGRRMGAPLGGYVGAAAHAASFVCSLGAMIAWLTGGYAGRVPILLPIRWLPAGAGVAQAHAGFLDIGLYVDSLTIAFFTVITLVGAAVNIFSIGYMVGDRRYGRYFAYLGLFSFSMMGLVIGGTLLHLFIFWELVGVCSYLLIGFWFEKRSASNAAIKAFIVNRIGDCGLLVGLGLLFGHVGNLTLPMLWTTLGDAGNLTNGGGIALADGGYISAGMLTFIGIALFLGAMGKSAQFPLHVWLPDAMEGPTPASALIHAATMVAAGVYLVARIYWILTPDARLLIAIIGATTLTLGALIAMAQTDIKRVLAYSTVSQLGYMMLALGVGSWIGGLFHLITHAFFKALLFLAAGSVIHAAHHEQEMPQFGGLWRRIPWTAAAFAVGLLAIAGVGALGVGFSGYYSKDAILARAAAFADYAVATGHSRAYWLLFILPAAAAYLTAFYMTRCFALTFLGQPRNQRLHDRAHERPIMWGPLVALAGLSAIGGFIGIQTMLRNAVAETRIAAGDSFTGAQNTWLGAVEGEVLHLPVDHEAGEESPAVSAIAQATQRGHNLTLWWVGPAFIVGIGLGLLIYLRGYDTSSRLVRIWPVGQLHTWLYRRMYFDELYFSVFVAVTLAFSYLAGWFDRYVIDGLVNLSAWVVRQVSTGVGLGDDHVVDGAVNGVGRLAHGFGAAARTPQNGRVRLYVTTLLLAIAAALAIAIVAAL